MGYLKAAIVFLGLAVLLGAHGYWYSTSLIDKYVQRCGAYPTLDEAIQADMRHNGFDPVWFEDYINSQNNKKVSYTWYVVPKIKPEYQAVYDQTPKPAVWCGGSFYEHTRAGWVGMPEHLLNATGYLDFWMWVYHLYG